MRISWPSAARYANSCHTPGNTRKDPLFSLFAEDPIVIKQILDHLKHKAETSGTRALPESRAPPAELLLGLFD